MQSGATFDATSKLKELGWIFFFFFVNKTMNLTLGILVCLYSKTYMSHFVVGLHFCQVINAINESNLLYWAICLYINITSLLLIMLLSTVLI